MPIYAKLYVKHIWYQQFTEFDYTQHYVNKDSPAGSFATKKKQFHHHHKYHHIVILDLRKVRLFVERYRLVARIVARHVAFSCRSINNVDKKDIHV